MMIDGPIETWHGVDDRGRRRRGHGTPWRDPDSYETDRLELGRDAASAWAFETLAPVVAVERRFDIAERKVEIR